jgi:hypothetical protein
LLVSAAKKPAAAQPLGDFDCCLAWCSANRAEHAAEREAEKAAKKAAKNAKADDE